MFGDVIKKEWLYEVEVKLHQCQDWCDTVTNVKVTNKVFGLAYFILSSKWKRNL